MEVIKSNHVTQDDFKFYMKRRVKNLGLLNKTIPYPGTTTATYGIATMTDRIMLVCFDGANPDFYRCDGDMTILQQIQSMTDGVGIHDAACLYNNQYFCSNEVVHKVWYIDADGNYKYMGTSTGVSGSGNADWNGPVGLKFSSKGQLYVCDKNNHRVKIYDYGIADAAPALADSYFVVSDADGYVYVADSTTYTVNKYTKAMVADSTFNVGDVANKITGMAYDSTEDKLYISKYSGEGVIRCETDGSAQTVIISTTNGKKLAVDANYIYVPGTNSQVGRYDKITGTYVDEIFLEGTFAETAHALKIYNGYLYALMPVLGKVLKVSVDDFVQASVTTVVTGLETGHCLFFDVDTAGFVYISDTTDDEILKYTSAGVSVSAWGSGTLDTPHGIAFNAYTNQVIICDTVNAVTRNYLFGLFIAKLEKAGGGAGTGHGEFTSPMSIAFDSAGYFYVKDAVSGTSRIQKFNAANTWDLEWSTPVHAPFSLMYSPTENRVYVNSYYFAYTYTTSGASERYFTYKDFVGATVYTSITAGFLYAIGSGNLYRYEITPDHESTWTDVTRYVFKNSLKLKYTTDESNFSLGKITVGDMEFQVNNESDKWDFESNMRSLFYDADFIYQRNQSIIKVELEGNEIARGLIDGKNIENEENLLTFKAYSPFKYMETILSTNIKPSLSDGDSISDVLLKTINNRYFDGIIEHNAADIDIYYDAVIDDVSELPDNTLDILVLLSKLGAFKFGLYGGYKFFANNVIDTCKAGAVDYLVTQNNLLGVEAYNNGEQRLFKQVDIKYGVNTASFILPDAVQVCFNEERIVEIQADCLTTGATVQACADNYQYFTTWPSKEITIIVPLLNYTVNLFAKTFAFNIFENDRGIKFNYPSLGSGNAALPAKQTAMDNSGRVIYYPLNIEHHIGKENFTILKLKEFIDDAA